MFSWCVCGFLVFWSIERSIVLGFYDTSTLLGHLVSSPREMEKRDRRDSKGDERGTGKKEENEWKRRKRRNKKKFPSTPTCCKGSRPCPTVSRYQLDALVSTVGRPGVHWTLCFVSPQCFRLWRCHCAWCFTEEIEDPYAQQTCL